MDILEIVCIFNIIYFIVFALAWLLHYVIGAYSIKKRYKGNERVCKNNGEEK